MSDHALHTLLPRGTKTWQQRNRESIVDLMLASEKLATSMVKCAIHTTEYGSDHKAIETTFNVITPERVVESRPLRRGNTRLLESEEHKLASNSLMRYFRSTTGGRNVQPQVSEK